MISAIESGKADYGLADASTTVQAIAKGSKVKGFQVYMDISTNGLAALTPLPTPESALGKTIATSPTDSTRVIYPIILKQKGLDPAKINWIAATPATYFTLLLSGQADIIAATVDGDMPPLMETAAKQNKKVYFSSFGSWGYDVLGLRLHRLVGLAGEGSRRREALRRRDEEGRGILDRQSRGSREDHDQVQPDAQLRHHARAVEAVDDRDQHGLR